MPEGRRRGLRQEQHMILVFPHSHEDSQKACSNTLGVPRVVCSIFAQKHIAVLIDFESSAN